MRRLILATSVFLIAGSALAGSPVATLAVSEGTVLVNQGKQFVTAQSNQVLAAGDRVMVMDGGSAAIKYADNCVTALNSGSLAVVSAKSVCAGDAANIAFISSKTAQAVGEDNDCDADGVLNDVDNSPGCNRAAGVWILAGVGVATAAYLISNGDDDNNNTTISP